MEDRITLEGLISLLEEAKVDYYKFYGKGNKAAATRLRKSLQDVSKACKSSRDQILEYKKTL